MNPINKKTAILIIHGIGEQNPFETLDQFARGFYKLYTDQFKNEKFTLQHKLLKQENNKGDKWIDSYVRILPGQTDQKEPAAYLDVHEYYWACLTEEQITTGEIADWLRETLQGAEQVYGQNVDEGVKSKRKNLSDLKRMIRYITYAFRFAKIISGFLVACTSFFHVIISFIAPASNLLKGVIDKIKNWTINLLRDYLGDVTIYTTMDVKKKHYELRAAILEGARVQLQALISNKDYDSVLVCGHSLGTVIAYDALNKISIRASLKDESELAVNCKKITGMVTFGSPLDKIFFFFSQHTEEKEYIRRQIINQLHSFKIKKNLWRAEKINVEDPVQHSLEDLPWINFYHKKDPVSNALDFYTLAPADNIQCNFPAKWGAAHVKYWEYDEMYKRIHQQFLN